MPDSNAWKDSIYTGQPSHASDAAWKKLQTGKHTPFLPSAIYDTFAYCNTISSWRLGI